MVPDDEKTRTYVTLRSGTMVSHYRIVEKIGAGGMGEVYLAEDTGLNRKVALKFLPDHLCQDAECRARFKREAQAAAKLDHPNIVAVHEVGEFQGRPFFAMQHVEGQSLKDVLTGKALPPNRIVEVGIQVCDGLQAAHEKGITHRDIKPSNILIDSHGRARIVDFGLASVKGTDQLTKTGSTLGTIGYMSPEQVRGDHVDHRTDLFSLGIVLYELIAGHPPFKADSEAATLNAITNSTPELLARFRREVPPELQSIIDKALEKHVSTRYQHADELSADLRRLSASRNQLGTPRRDPWNRYVVTSAAAVLMIVAGYWVVTSLLPTLSPKPESARKMLAVLPFENLGLPEDEYFADGITDEITGKLATIREFGVISRTSTVQYKSTTKSLRQIAKELGVEYILEGTIRWDKGSDTSRVRILPQLIRVSDDTHLWTEIYQRPLTDIFSVQEDIAANIASALSATLADTRIASIPTKNLDAYQAYLRGIDYLTRPDWGPEEFQLGVQMLQRAVELDSLFAMAYARLAWAHAWVYHFGFDRTPDRLHSAREALDRASELQPDLPWIHMALSYYYYLGYRDYDRALQELNAAEAVFRSSGEICELRGYIERRQGHWPAAIEQLERAFQLDPRSSALANEIAYSHLYLGEYELAEQFANCSIALKPDQVNAYLAKVDVYYRWKGDTASARRVLSSIPVQDADDTRLAWYGLHRYERDCRAALGDLASLPELLVDLHNITPKAQLAGIAYHLMNEDDSARAAFDLARVALENELRARPDDYRIPCNLGLVYAYLGRKEEAIRNGKLGVDLLPYSRDAFFGPDQVEKLAAIYVIVGEQDAALDQVEFLLSNPGMFSVAYLRLDPWYDPLRTLPRYQQLVEKYGT